MKIFQVIFSIAFAQVAGIVGSIFTSNSISTWYQTITKPAINPPSWLFAPVWTTLYTLMGISAFLVWQKRGLKIARVGLWVYLIQLILNSVWSFLFFGAKNPGLAFVEIIILLIFIIINTILFWRVNKWAGILMLPYIAWVSFASYLNYQIWMLN